jgi:hypothetical protein
MEFTASLDTTAKIVTFGVCALFGAICIWNVVGYKKNRADKVAIIVRLGIFAVLLFSICASFHYSTKSYEIHGKSLIIKTQHGEIPLTWMQISDVKVLTNADMEGLTRPFGVGGLFGYNGHYHSPAIGDITFYATQQKNWVLIHTDKNEAIIMTPDDPTKLAYEIKAIITPNN